MIKKESPRVRIENKIFSNYSIYASEKSTKDSENMLYYDLSKWIRVFSFIKNDKTIKEHDLIDEMGLDIYKLVKDLKTKKFVYSGQLFKYINIRLKYIKIDCLGKHFFREVGKIPGKYKKLEELLYSKEKDKGSELTDEEKRKIISFYMNEAKYFEIKNMVNNVISSDNGIKNEEGKEIDLLSTDRNARSVFDNDNTSEMLNIDSEQVCDELRSIFNISNNMYGIKTDELCEAIDHVLTCTPKNKKRTKKVRIRNRALLTAYCLKHTPKIIKDIMNVLDKEILKKYDTPEKTNKINQYDIYWEFHPKNRSKKSIEASASRALDELFEDINKYFTKIKSNTNC